MEPRMVSRRVSRLERPSRLNGLTLRPEDPEEEAPTHKRPLQLSLLLRIFGYMRPYTALRNWLLVLVSIRSIQLPVLAWLIGYVIKSPIAANDVHGVFLGTAAFALLAFTTQLVFHFRVRLALQLGEVVVRDLRQEVFAKLQQLSIGFFDTTKLGRIISRMTSDVDQVRVGVQELLFTTIVQLGQMAVAGGLMLWYDSTLFLLVLALAPVFYVVNRRFHIRLSQVLRQVQESFSRVTSTLAESVHGMRVTQAFVRQDVNAEIFDDVVNEHADNHLTMNGMHGAYVPQLEFTSQFLIAGLLVVGGYQVFESRTANVGDLVMFFMMASMFVSPITHLGNIYHQALTSMAGAERVFALLDRAPDGQDPPGAHHFASGERLQGEVEFRGVSFGYLPRRTVLRDLDFIIRPGETVALVGPTGSGKTSIVNLIAKFYVPTSGQVLVDGHEIRELSTPWLRSQLGIVLQQNFLFSGSVAGNIRIGKPDASDQEILDVLDRMDCGWLLDDLPAGIDSDVGERGHALSAGQRQLVCFARAMLADPAILILDEATSSVDPLTERRIQRALENLLVGRTSIVIAHRLSTIQDADQVFVLDQGRIVERGSHDWLLDHAVVYARLHRSFAKC